MVRVDIGHEQHNPATMADNEFYQPNEGRTENVRSRPVGAGAWGLSCSPHDACGAVILQRVCVPQPGQAPGPRIHHTLPLVPTGRRGAPILRFARQNSSSAVAAINRALHLSII